MNNIPCWNDLEFNNIIKPDTEEIDDNIFLNMHCQSDLYITSDYNGKGIKSKPDDLVNRFLDPNDTYQQVIIIGDSGTGKSHLIQWLRLQMQIILILLY